MLKIEDMVGILLGMEFDKMPHMGLMKVIPSNYINLVKRTTEMFGEQIMKTARISSSFMYNYPCRVLASTIKG